jgi:hypothetical protein
MKYLNLATCGFMLTFLGCASPDSHKTSKTTTDTSKQTVIKETSITKSDSTYTETDVNEIQTLVRNMLVWAESKKSFDLVPVITDKADTSCIGFDLEKVKANLEILQSTGYFSARFIENYNQILVTLDKEMKAKKFTAWSTGELPPFNFANDVDPWSDCQDEPYDTPNPYDLVDVHVVNLNQKDGELYWTWGKLGADVDPSWKKFTYKFKVEKEDGKWKIAYLEGFDFKQSVSVP